MSSSGLVEDVLGRKVIAFLSDHHIDPDIAVEMFVLGGRRRRRLETGLATHMEWHTPSGGGLHDLFPNATTGVRRKLSSRGIAMAMFAPASS